MAEHRSPESDELDRYLAGSSDLSRLYRETSHEEPSAHHRQAILDYARRHAPGKVKPASWLASIWRGFDRMVKPIAALATITVVVTLSLMVRDEKGDDALVAPDNFTTLPPAAPASSQPAPPAPPESLDSATTRVPETAQLAAQKHPSPRTPSDRQVSLSVRNTERTQVGTDKNLPFWELDTTKAVAKEPVIDWLERIRQLIQMGRLDEARQEVDAFSKSYPDYPLPADLAPLSKDAAVQSRP